MYRLFVGLDLPEEVKNQLSRIQSGIEGARWRPIENFHLTLAFLGAADRHQYSDAIEALSTIEMQSFDLALSGIGMFGDRKPRAIWAGVKPNSELNHLRERVESVIRGSGFDLERRKFTPHVTLAYLKGVSQSRAMTYCADNGLFSSKPFMVDAFHLFSSTLGAETSVYSIEASYALSSSK